MAGPEKNPMDHREPQHVCQFQHLPDDVQCRILKLVIDPALKNTPFSITHLTYAHVCRQWKSMVYSLIGTIDLFRLVREVMISSAGREPRAKEFFEQVLCFLRKRKESIRFLKLSCTARDDELFSRTIGDWRGFLNPAALNKMLRATPQLEALRISLDYACLEAEVVMPSIKCMSFLKRFTLRGITTWGSGSPLENPLVNGLAKSCPSLEVLTLCLVHVNDETMTNIGQLRCLKEFCATYSSITDRGMQALCKGSGCIELLSLVEVQALTNQSAHAIATGSATQRHLKELQLEKVGTINGGGLYDILDRCERLSILGIELWGDYVEKAFTQYFTRWPSRRLNVRKLQYFVHSDCALPAENLHLLERLCLKTDDFGTYWTESKVLGLSGLSNLRCLDACFIQPRDAAAVRALEQLPKLDTLMIGNLDEAEVSVLIDCFSERLIRLLTGRVPKQCVQRIAKSFTKLTLLWMTNAYEGSVRKMIAEWSAATVWPPGANEPWDSR